MNAGDEFREAAQRGDALAVLAIGAIRDERETATGDETTPAPRYAYILRSLKHPNEVKTLRRIYGSGFVLVADYSPRSARLNNLARQIAESHNAYHVDEFLPVAQKLINRDAKDIGKELGQNTRLTFPMADVFVSTDDAGKLRTSVERFVRLLFSSPFETPTRDKYGMFHARAAALRSASLSRQVGAVIATSDGDIVSVGTNEVPKAGGGLYWSGDAPDHRDFVMGYDTSDRIKRNILKEALTRLRENNWLSPEKTENHVETLVADALAGRTSPLKGAHVLNVIEFGRSVHAEMAAIVDAARRGVSVGGCTLYTTTYPCHDCARHIVAAGISRVVYIDPYPKSLAEELYLDSILVKLGIHLTQVTPRCSMRPRGGLSTRPARVRGTLRQRRGLSRLSVRVALAGGFPLSGMRA